MVTNANVPNTATTTGDDDDDNNNSNNNRSYPTHGFGYDWSGKHLESDEEDDFLQRIVHGSCQGGGCHNTGERLTCHMSEHMDLFMVRCFFNFFYNHFCF